MYYFPQPPFLVAIFGIFIAVTFGLTFQNQLDQKLSDSYSNPQQENSFKLEDSVLISSYWGICLGVWVFLGGGFLIFGFGVIPSYGTALLITILTGSFVWQQIGEVLLQLKTGGSKALELE